ncbi:MAG: GNAT family N-acetyltransferase [Clostridiales Family XIII bacterium]|jgi:GNAT superfamily N-acetyltransferase|nr:GNAT family N-acetyltransferase [Clostridiales Family XIII bacterium]
MLQAVRINDANIKYFEEYFPPAVRAKYGRPEMAGIGVSDGATAIGAMLTAVVGNAAHVVWIFVTAANRRRGAGKLLVKTLVDAAAKDGLKHVTVTYSGRELSGGFEDFLAVCGFSTPYQSDSCICTFKLEDYNRRRLANAILPKPYAVIPLEKAPAWRVNKISIALKDTPKLNIDLPIRCAEYIAQSPIAIRDDGSAGACLLRQVNDRHVEIALLHVIAGGAAVAAPLFRTAMDVICNHYPENAEVSMYAATSATMKLLETVAARVEKTAVLAAQIMIGKG